MDVIRFVLILLSLLLTLPVAVYAAEVLAACWRTTRRNDRTNSTTRPRVAVLIPAHNEELGIARTVRSIAPQLAAGDRLVVVADNCSDETVAVARELRATVLERNDQLRRGKGFALAFGLDYLLADPPEVVLFFDADCRITPGTIEALATAAQDQNRPVQALNLCVPTAEGSSQQRLSGLAFRFKNLIRMTGLARLGAPCHLTGTGMGMPWQLVDQVPWATGNVVEDMQLGLDLTVAGYPPMFVPHAEVHSELPPSDEGVMQQRRRWEHGFLQTALTQMPQLVNAAVVQRSWRLLLLAFDLAVPPLALLSLLLMLAWAGALGIFLVGLGAVPLVMMTLALSLFAGATLIGWSTYCRELAPVRLLWNIPRYLASKLPLYIDFFRQRQQTWVRAQR